MLVSAPAPARTLTAAPAPETPYDVLRDLARSDRSAYVTRLVANWPAMRPQERRETLRALMQSSWLPAHIRRRLESTQ